jgi:hypothetical protein
MADVQVATDIDLAPAAIEPIEARKERMPLGVIAYVVLALSAEALWLGLICWWLLNLF